MKKSDMNTLSRSFWKKIELALLILSPVEVRIGTSLNFSAEKMYIIITIIIINLTTGVQSVPLTNLPRTEVLEIVSSNQQAVLQQNETTSKVKSNGTNICMTKGCVKASALILDLIDENIDPCENVYEFSCGKFLRNTFIPDDKIAMMSFVHVQDKVLGQLRLILNERSSVNESKPFTLAKTFNAACMDQETLEIEG